MTGRNTCHARLVRSRPQVVLHKGERRVAKGREVATRSPFGKTTPKLGFRQFGRYLILQRARSPMTFPRGRRHRAEKPEHRAFGTGPPPKHCVVVPTFGQHGCPLDAGKSVLAWQCCPLGGG